MIPKTKEEYDQVMGIGSHHVAEVKTLKQKRAYARKLCEKLNKGQIERIGKMKKEQLWIVTRRLEQELSKKEKQS